MTNEGWDKRWDAPKFKTWDEAADVALAIIGKGGADQAILRWTLDEYSVLPWSEESNVDFSQFVCGHVSAAQGAWPVDGFDTDAQLWAGKCGRNSGCEMCDEQVARDMDEFNNRYDEEAS